MGNALSFAPTLCFGTTIYEAIRTQGAKFWFGKAVLLTS
jgi:hypothetical protein